MSTDMRVSRHRFRRLRFESRFHPVFGTFAKLGGSHGKIVPAILWLVFGVSFFNGAALAVERGNGILSSQPFEFSGVEVSSRTLFQELDPEDTGMADFVNDYGSPHLWGKHWRTYLFGAIGTGVAIGDVDGDGLPDIFAVSKNERSRLYRNLGGFRFEDVTESSGIDDGKSSGIDKNETSGGGAAFADVNNDGHLDLYLCYLGAPNQLWINDGTGHFDERSRQWGVNVTTASVMGYFADYDADGLLDLYLATNLLQEGDDYPGPRPDHLFRNTGDHFVETTAAAGISGVGHAHSAVWWDYNGDGRLDIYVANDFAGVDRLYRNKGEGAFEDVIAASTPRIPYYAMGSDFGDVNNDGLDDFWVADMAPSDRARYKRTLESHKHVYEGTENVFPHQYMENTLLLNLTGERFADVAALAGLHRTDWTWASRLVDLDNDGWLDAFATNGMLRNFNDGDLGMRLQGRNNLQHYAQIFRPTPVLEETNLAYRNLDGIRFESAGVPWGLNKLGVSFGAAFADLDRNGSLDLVLSNFKEPPSVYRGLESEESRAFIELRGNESNHFGVGARVEVSAGGQKQVKILMPHRGYMSSDEPLLHFGLGDARQIDRMTIRWPSGIVQRLENLAVNHRYLVEERGDRIPPTGRPSPRFHRVKARFPEKASRQDAGAGEFSQQPLLPFARSRLTGSATSGDLNGDGRADLILGGFSGQETTVLTGGDDFIFEEVWSLDLEEDFPSTDAGMVLIDLNGDESLDLVAVSGGTSLDPGDPGFADRLYLGDGRGGFVREFDSPLSEAMNSSAAVASGDFDGDGFTDLFVAGATNPGRYPESSGSTLWKGRGDGSFERVSDDVAPGLAELGRVSAAEWVDFKSDGFPDLVVLQEWSPPQLWRNREGQLTRDTGALGSAELSGIWTSMAVGDFDGDGRLDMAAGNLGLNSGGLWNPGRGPRRLWWRGDTRAVQLIETHEESGSEYPVAWRDHLKETSFGRSVSTRSYQQFAGMTVSELFGNLEEKGFAALELSEPRSGIFWQQDDGSFTFETLPSFAQSGRMAALLAADVDRDGISDLVTSIEPSSPAPWTGRAEQGHVALFLGNTDRQFEVEFPGVSGLDVGASSPRQLLWADFNGDGVRELAIVPAQGEPQIFAPSN